MPRVWLITGASSGFGRRATEEVLADGDIVVATVRAPTSLDDLVTKYASDRLLVVQCDVTTKSDITALFNAAYDKFGRVDVVLNNAGLGAVAEVESEDQDELARKIFEVNFWGATNVSREAVKGFRDRNPAGTGGRLINVSSAAGHVGSPGMGFYVSSKHALEGLTETLAKELDPAWNIKVTLVEPGMFKTEAYDGRLPFFTSPPAYANPQLPSQLVRGALSSQALPFQDARKAVRQIINLSKLESPPLRLPLGPDALAAIKDKIAQFSKEIEQYEGWSQGLELEK
ncbi:hypothetical protein ONZ45_g6716 [Pleurotus djamor]|nr:hypothetical protein ONZ45_g6716 [Pleurotus djamor]